MRWDTNRPEVVAFRLAAAMLAFGLGAANPAWAQSCVTPNDCQALNGPCSLGACIGNQCERQPINEGQACLTSNPCVAPATCNAGYCVGHWQLNCCTGDPDCDDYNPCTTDTCVSNSCVHANAPAGTSCGSQVDDACTGPDTCDADGSCQHNDAPDGADCGGPDCLGGECGPTTFQARLLPEDGDLGSEARGMSFLEGDPDQPIVLGRVIDGGGIDHAAAWTCAANGSNCTLMQLPEGGAGTSVANGVACGQVANAPFYGVCLAVGSKGSPPQPAAWLYDGVAWSAEAPPLPSGATAGFINQVSASANKISPNGSSWSTNGYHQAALWERDELGFWSVFLLPDFGSSGRGSTAVSMAVCPEQAPDGLCVAGATLVAGWADDGPKVRRPVVWRETGPESGVFEMTVLPLPQGATEAYDEGDTATHEVGHWLSFNLPPLPPGPPILTDIGTVALTDGTTRGVVWTTSDVVVWNVTVLPPLAGHSSSFGTGRTVFPEFPNYDPLFVYGVSYSANGNPLVDGVATQWILDPNTLTLASGPTNTNTMTSGLSTGCFVALANPIWLEFPMSWSGVVTCPGSGIPRGPTLQPHAAIAVAAGPAGIPALSTWGFVSLALVITCSATVLLLRKRATKTTM